MRAPHGGEDEGLGTAGCPTTDPEVAAKRTEAEKSLYLGRPSSDGGGEAVFSKARHIFYSSIFLTQYTFPVVDSEEMNTGPPLKTVALIIRGCPQRRTVETVLMTRAAPNLALVLLNKDAQGRGGPASPVGRRLPGLAFLTEGVVFVGGHTKGIRFGPPPPPSPAPP